MFLIFRYSESNTRIILCSFWDFTLDGSDEIDFTGLVLKEDFYFLECGLMMLDKNSGNFILKNYIVAH